MSFQLVIPGGLLSSRARVCFTNRGRLLENDRSKARTIFDPVLVCLNFLSHEWGASQIRSFQRLIFRPERPF